MRPPRSVRLPSSRKLTMDSLIRARILSGTSTSTHVRCLAGRSRSPLCGSEHRALELARQLFDIAGSRTDPIAVIVFAGIAVAFGKGEKTSTQSVLYQLKQSKKIFGSVCGWCTRKHVYHRCFNLWFFKETPRQLTALRTMVLQKVCFIKHEPFQRQLSQRRLLPLQQVVVDDYPTGI